MPGVADPEKFHAVLAAVRKDFRANFPAGFGVDEWRRYGTASALLSASANGVMAVKNYSLGTFDDVDAISGVSAERKIWARDFACYCCPLSCKKAGVVRGGRYAGLVHDGPEYETGGMMGSNLMIDDLGALMKAIFEVDDWGLDQHRRPPEAWAGTEEGKAVFGRSRRSSRSSASGFESGFKRAGLPSPKGS